MFISSIYTFAIIFLERCFTNILFSKRAHICNNLIFSLPNYIGDIGHRTFQVFPRKPRFAIKRIFQYNVSLKSTLIPLLLNLQNNMKYFL